MRQLLNHLRMIFLVSLFVGGLTLPACVFAKEGTCEVSFPVKVEVEGKDIPTGIEYTIELEAVTENAPVPKSTSLIIRDGGKGEFGPFLFSVPGDYQYRVKQKKGTRSHMSYDETEYTVTIRVLNGKDRELETEVWAQKKGSDQKCDLVYKNHYRPPEPHEESKNRDSHHRVFHDTSGVSGSSVIRTFVPKTGDDAKPFLWVGLLILSIGGIWFWMKRRKES